ncbi:MAG: hypothetical protein R3A48_07860 [Polyangiales bacterium]
MSRSEMTTDELMQIADWVSAKNAGLRAYEAIYASLSGWDSDEFLRLYAVFIDSTQVALSSNGNQTTNAKGNPLEVVSRYFLEKGGVARNMKPGGVPGKWTVDGIGETYPDRVDRILGAGMCATCGPQIYLEAKNHSDVLQAADWAQHNARMKNHGCRLGVVISTGGYAVRAGLGYADELYHDWIRGFVHILLSVDDLRQVAIGGEFPWSIVKTAFIRVVNQEFEQPPTQLRYSKAECLKVAKAEYDRLHPPSTVVAATTTDGDEG